MSTTKIGFIGVGVMGAPMAGHLAKAGYPLTIHDIDREKARSVAGQHEGIKIAETPREVATAADVVITMLPSGKYVQEVALGENGLISGFRPGALLVDTSSSEPWMTRDTASALAQSVVEMADAPVSGAEAGAIAGTLVFMVGGKEEIVAKISPLLQTMGKKIFHLGPVGAGHAMKCINNLITSITFMATTEGLVVGKQFGLDPDVMTDVLNVSTGMSWISQTHIKQRITPRKFDDPFRLELMVKDIGIAMELAGRNGVPVPLAALGHQLWRSALRNSEQGASISEMVRWVEHMTGTEIKGGSSL